MSKSNSKACKAGYRYEHKVFKLLKGMLKEGKIPGATEFSRLYYHKKYFDEFGVSVNPDISIEVYRTRRSKRPELILIFECKFLNDKVDSGLYNEFQANLERIRRTSIKGYIVTNRDFPESVVRRSVGTESGYSSGIGLIVYNSDGVKWVSDC